VSSQLTLLRETFTPYSTAGRLLIAGKFECYTLEDAYREIKIPGQTCIPYGQYELAIMWSDRFKRTMPYLLYVPNFRGVMLHNGNTDQDTDGCILVGQQPGPDRVNLSVAALDIFYPKVMALIETQHTYIDILKG